MVNNAGRYNLPSCNHPQVACINPYEIIRKYECETCGAVMMCACEEEFARRFLPHQLREGTELRTRRRIPVTLGFQSNICNTCRGLPEEAYPKAEIYGASSKIRRYYWREIIFQTTKRFTDWATNEGYKDYEIALRERRDEREKIERLVIEEIKDFHNRTPKYTFQEQAQSEVLAKNKVEIVNLAGIYTKTEDGRLGILVGGRPCSAEEFTGEHYSQRGYQILTTESIPFHVLFGTFMWLLIQDPTDPLVRIVGFGDRTAFDERRNNQQVWTHLPEDFGTPVYPERRQEAIKKHFENIPQSKEDLLWLFNYWIEPSSGLRQYLWAHRSSDIERTRQLIQILSVDEICRVLKYLVGDYWRRYIGWPDLLVYKSDEYFFAEVKSSSDKLREDQKSWIYANTLELHLPFKLVKIHKQLVKKAKAG